MRLLNTTSLQLEVFLGEMPDYAILSHRWEDEEVTFEDMASTGNAKQMKGFAKIESSACRARKDGYEYIWIDTCCIDKSSSAELSEAINSMFHWYRSSERCLVYLADVSSLSELHESRWFKRGWTLQELIAPRDVHFLSKDWEFLGDKLTLRDQLQSITAIARDVLLGADLSTIPACSKMSWASKRATTRPEDVAYCLMGLFNVNMPLLYGEGAEKAFRRLQEEFIRQSDDESIFAWTADPDEVDGKPYWGLLATSPAYFRRSGGYTIPRFKAYRQGRPTEITNNGLRISLIVQPLEEGSVRTLYLAALNCSYMDDEADEFSSSFTITLQRLSDFETQFARIRPDAIIPIGEPSGTEWPAVGAPSGEPQTSQLFVRSAPRTSDPVAGFCVCGETSVGFTFMAGSSRGPMAIPGHIEATFVGGDDAVKNMGQKRRYCFLDISAAEADLGLRAFDVCNLRRRRVVGYLQMKLGSRLDDRPPPSNRIVPSSSYKDTYLVVGLEPLPENQLGTPPGFVRPWYTFSDSCEEEALAGLASGSAPVKLEHMAPGGASVRVCFAAGTYRFRTYHEIQLVNVDSGNS
ncbi:Uncharacterized protein TCAP_05390 [Tolypocladium capitatum]|uniref:Uncharacterized protein n=1 Tax=Tolypocladium capitatum TaxID=45235 RepID=A0A2K3QAU8_9HYPO|nr:Uncharacterized protein TCAP_05390 [Tolypocladium capitatum]